jgi:hypothetical protein
MSEIFGSLPWALGALGTLVALTLLFALDTTRRRRTGRWRCGRS